MTRGLVWFHRSDSSCVEILGSMVDSWLVELPYDFHQDLYSLEYCRDRRASDMPMSSEPSVVELTMNNEPDENGVEIPYWKLVDPTLEQRVRWDTEASLVFRTPPHFGGAHVAFWEVSDPNLAKEVLWINVNAGINCLGAVRKV